MQLTADPAPMHAPGLALTWLGQAGFWLSMGQHQLLIDPYLSDSLARKYAGKRFDHQRMMPPPIVPEALPRPDLVLVTHAHTDHMDADTLGPLARRFPDLPFMVPGSAMEVARMRIGEAARLVPVDAFERRTALPGLHITVFSAAHEARDLDRDGRHVFLGYGVGAADLKIAHPGDTIPFDDLTAALQRFAPDIALFPVNGRDADRRAGGIPGNMTLEEAVTLAGDVGAGLMVPHHFGMFAFNSCDPAAIDAAAANASIPIVRLEPGMRMRISHQGGGDQGDAHG